MKRPLEEEEEKGAEMEEAEAKRACREGANSEMEEFFALLERIEATEKLRKGVNTQKQVVTCEPVWRPAFVWEDFCRDPNGNRTRDVESKPQEEEKKDKNTYDFLNRGRSPSSDPNPSNDEGCAIQTLDLNVPSAGMQLFF